MVSLEEYNEKYINDYVNYILEFQKYGDDFDQFYESGLMSMNANAIANEFINLTNYSKLYKKQETVPIVGHVNCDMYLVVNDGKMIGEISFRKRLSRELIEVGGHIGYKIKPSERKHGYCTEALKLLLNKAWNEDYTELELKCNENNVASIRVIEKVGGYLHKVSNNFFAGKEITAREYWIFKGF